MTSYPRLLARIERKTVQHPISGCWIWFGPVNKGYGRMGVYVKGKTVTYYAHRVAWEAYHERRLPRGRVVAHSYKCISPLCCNPLHLRATLQKHNIRDKKRASRWRQKTLSNSTLYPPSLSLPKHGKKKLPRLA